ncbi:MAG: hypothetical protein ABJ360_03335 [Roseobacter sp.]|uniref:hypothetical protein n=1 Tax=Pseudomonadota TaxID=1224 RepID=UPI003265589E
MIWPFSKKPKPMQNDPLTVVRGLVKHLGYDLTHYGAGVALLSIESGYSVYETASHIVVVSFARDAQWAEEVSDLDATMKLAPIGIAILQNLKHFKDNGDMRLEIWENDTTSISKLMTPSPETSDWVAKILSDPVVAKDAVATSRIINR